MKLARALLIFVILLFCNDTCNAGIIGKDAPDISVRKWLTPNPPTQADLKSRVYVIEFWATWCQPCVKSMPHIMELANTYKDKGVIFIGISQDNSTRAVQKFIRRRKVNYHIAMDNATSRRFPFASIPTAFVINHTGKVSWQSHPLDPDFELAITRALAAAPQSLLADIDLGPFANLRPHLWGGKNFALAYNILKKETNSESTIGLKAAKILKTINSRIEDKTNQTHLLRQTDPVASFMFYRWIVHNFGSTEPAKPAETALKEFENDDNFKTELRATNAVFEVDRLLANCRRCPTCYIFNPECQWCAELNKPATTKAVELLTTICQHFPGTKAAAGAQAKLDKLNGNPPQSKSATNLQKQTK